MVKRFRAGRNDRMRMPAALLGVAEIVVVVNAYVLLPRCNEGRMTRKTVRGSQGKLDITRIKSYWQYDVISNPWFRNLFS